MNNPPYERKNDSDLSRAMIAVLIELTDVLGEYRDSLVLSGGLAMRLLLGGATPPSDEDRPDTEEPFARETKDVDLVLNLVRLGHDFDDQIDTIGEALTRSDYQQETPRQFWVKVVSLPGFSAPVEVIVEFLVPTPHDAGLDHSLPAQIAEQQEIQPAVLDGIALALLQPQQIRLTGETLSGAVLTDITVPVVHPAMLILIKAIAFDDRLKKHNRHPEHGHLDHAAKHAYDISKLLLRYPGGVSALVERLTPPYITSPGPEQATVDRALQSLRAHFADRGGAGVRLMALEGEYRSEEEEREIAQQGTVARVSRLLQRLDEQAESIF